MTLKELSQKILKDYDMVAVRGGVKEIPGDWREHEIIEEEYEMEVVKYKRIDDPYVFVADMLERNGKNETNQN